MILAFEKMEALRWLYFLKKGGMCVVNDQEIDPMPVIMGKAEYPANCTEAIRARVPEAVIADAEAIAGKLGNVKGSEYGAIGLSGQIPRLYNPEQWKETLRQTVPPKTVELNIKAFEAGFGQ